MSEPHRLETQLPELTGAARLAALLELGKHLIDREPPRVLVLAGEAVVLARALEHPDLPQALLLLGRVQWVLSRLDDARASCTEALEGFRAQGNVSGEAEALRALGHAAYRQSRHTEALEHFRAALDRAHRTGDTLEQARNLMNEGVVHSDLGDYAAALGLYLEALHRLDRNPAALEPRGLTELRAMVLGNLGEAHRRLGQHREGLGYQQEAHRAFVELGNERLQAITLLNLGILHNLLEERPAALAALRRALALHRGVGERRGEIITLHTLAGLLHKEGEAEQACALFGQALEHARAQGDRRLLAEVQLRRAAALCGGGDTDAALEALSEALALAQAGEYRVEAGQAHRQLAQLHAQTGDWQAAYAHFQEAYAHERQLFGEEQERRIQALRVQHQLEQTRRVADAERALNEELRRSKDELEQAYRRNQDLLRHVQRQAHRDPLTGLPNRRHFEECLEHTRAEAEQGGGGFAVMFLDLDGFKAVNDRLGHAVGDELLVAVAGRLRGALREGDTLARLGGDEFMVIAPGLATPRAGRALAERLLATLKAPFSLRGHEVAVGASLGVATYPHDATDTESLQRRADSAMYRAKRAGGGVQGADTAPVTPRSPTLPP